MTLTNCEFPHPGYNRKVKAEVAQLERDFTKLLYFGESCDVVLSSLRENRH